MYVSAFHCTQSCSLNRRGKRLREAKTNRNNDILSMDECSCCRIHTAQYCFDLLYMCTKLFACMLSGETDVKLSAGPTAVSDEGPPFWSLMCQTSAVLW